jgi:hypothetical protein
VQAAISAQIYYLDELGPIRLKSENHPMQRLTGKALALAFMGWYLMVPPVSAPNGTDGARLMMEAPLSRWFTHGSFDSAKQCEEAQRSSAIAILKDITDLAVHEGCPEDWPLGKCAGTGPMFNAYGAMYNSQCIATDDPRLREN